MTQIIATFYKFVALPDCADRIAQLRDLSQGWAVQGTLLLASEGINGAIAGSAAAVERAIADLRTLPPFADLTPKRATTPTPPFQRLKIKQKAEIVTFGIPDADPNRAVGTYVAPADWNALITRPDVVLVDTRNDYEVQIGTFQGAHDPRTASFREFPHYVQDHLNPHTHPKVALFCTGGIRCEKATAYLLQQGFPEVYHLQGGILNYLDQIPPEQSLWQGECFVFDERVTVQPDLTPGNYTLCHHCGYPLRQGTTVCPDCQTEQSPS
ncbi:rhodanese-related sulfurtransferase [Spirulina major CS-329]|uniref:oxygen-dependent tRNA uridine(34) hydroxylase TrhO n=1 Tax=Spirulina TaxID=1154 RepID=UPI00232D3979|nr:MULTISPECIES: rhodanese-related sulfurtransferase [Spirulina]MDB9496469.1 rhodanese-related sulfurtransferase [Spirulina subsalsa CS-330]MDB9502683.1 rhodanese-related sulfurtransferase [Spirulina major CS-329]